MTATPNDFRHEMIALDDVIIHAIIAGEGLPLVLIHGFPQTWQEWRHVMPRLAETHTVVAVDLRGAGHSDTPQGGYDKVTLAMDVHGVMTKLGFDRYAVCGHDIGAMVALALAATQRDAVTRLVALDASQPGWSQWQDNFADPRNWHFAFHEKRDLPELLIAGREYDHVSTFIFERAYNPGAFRQDDLEAFARSFAQPGNTRGGLKWYRAFPADHAHALEWKQTPLASNACRSLASDAPAPAIACLTHATRSSRPIPSTSCASSGMCLWFPQRVFRSARNLAQAKSSSLETGRFSSGESLTISTATLAVTHWKVCSKLARPVRRDGLLSDYYPERLNCKYVYGLRRS